MSSENERVSRGVTAPVCSQVKVSTSTNLKANGLVIVNSCSSRFYGCELNDVVLSDVL